MSDETINLKKKVAYLEEKLKRYEKLLKKHNIHFEDNLVSNENKIELSTHEKLSIYKDYFKGRSDCYAIRWEKDGKSGYAPSYSKEARFLNKDEKKKIPFSNRYEKVSDEIILKHLKGQEIIGIYPMTDNQTCYFLAFDFDEESWKNDVLKFSEICLSHNIDHLVEISKSGKGAHLWIFFENAVLAKDARKLGRYLLTKTMMTSGLMSFKSFDRMFPSQDYIEKEGIGNLIALPLQGKSGMKGTTLFVDQELKPYPNQYQVLKSIRKVTDEEFGILINEISKDDELGLFGESVKKIELDMFDFIEELKIKINNQIVIQKRGLSAKAIQVFKRVASIVNPEFYKKQNMRVSTYGISRIIELYEETHQEILIPIGLLENVLKILNDNRILYEIDDLRIKPKMKKNIKFSGDLKDEQQNVLKDVLHKTQGVIVAPTGFGKTVLGVALISELKLKTLIIVNRVNLAEQWESQIKKFTSNINVGKLYDQYNELGADIDIATIQSLVAHKGIDEIVKNYGLIIIDEAHHVASRSYERLIRKFHTKNIIGLTATLKRSDGLESIITAMIGPVITEVVTDSKQIRRLLTVRLTGFKVSLTEEASINDSYQKLYENKERNEMIIKDIKASFETKKNILVLTDRMSHISILEKEISKITKHLLIVHGRLSTKEKKDFNEKLISQKEPFIILATGKYIGEGFDDDRLDTLFLTMPFRWKGTLQQYVGRLNRLRENKHEIGVYDYADIGVKYFSNMYLERLKGYRKMGYEISTAKEYESRIYYLNNYEETLKDDLKTSKEIVFISRHSIDSKIDFLINYCNSKPLLLLGNEYPSSMIIIDRKIVWYGSINPFVYKQQVDADIMRYEDSLLAEELIISNRDNSSFIKSNIIK
ncbi:Type III restriction protein res subunit [Alteracholeplasma palmae J233]|uniref:Type III restriction protein res subunit n=1 Tax=Alteracholeplasma palmae (strain ATCC 49389 / J233) TaxID=1318466 RepID=U4KJY3_ALTPJ|nr:DEAD/DEAH box helicase family protein [Alteracholeplasma palmae]CCV63783.1 Type III restriction protein res subunit [Alteracholeplasma palmae J233]